MESSALQHLRRLLNRTPNRFESLLVSRLEGALDAPAAAILRKQMAAVNRVQRHSQSRETFFYRIKRGKTNWRGIEQFPLQDLERKFATVTFVEDGTKKKAVLWLVEGRLLSIHYDAALGKACRAGNVQILSVKLHVDPMTPSQSPPEQPALPASAVAALSGWLREWTQGHTVRDLRAPLAADERRKRLAQFETAYPDDYLQLLEQTDGCLVDDHAIFGACDMYEIVLDDGNYCLVAEVDDKGSRGYLGLKCDSADGGIYYLNPDIKGSEPLGESFQKAMERFLKNTPSAANPSL